jgi:hypothetical protein
MLDKTEPWLTGVAEGVTEGMALELRLRDMVEDRPIEEDAAAAAEEERQRRSAAAAARNYARGAGPGGSAPQ